MTEKNPKKLITEKLEEMNTTNGAKQMSSKNRTRKGSSLLELPCTLFVFLIMLLMPMLNLATTTLRCSLMGMAVTEGAHVASKAHSYESGTTDKPSAITLANDLTNAAASRFGGLHIDSIETAIIITNAATGSVTRQTGRLTTPPDSSRFIYQIETNVRAHIDPLFQFTNAFGDIAGLTAALPMNYSSREMFENPSGLTQ
ncbi:MAG: hypothetical protein K2X77_06730 [Candidatus Obscuribacterales bacterium]|jgi:competence protein ComGC|nr:hypothetical protein [Candidatus Obscuribacterales bacterium]